MKNAILPLFAAVALVACNDKAELPLQPADETAAAPNTASEAAWTSAKLEAWQPIALDAPKTELCAIDAVNGETGGQHIRVPLNGPLTVIGWVSTEDLRNPGDLKIVLKGAQSFQIPGRTGLERRDVMDAYSSAHLLNAGFQVDLASLQVPAGSYQLILQHDAPSASFTCDGRTRIEVTP